MKGLRKAVKEQKRRQHDMCVASEEAARIADSKALDFTQIFVSVPQTERDRIMKLPQHFHNGTTNPEWLSARRHVMTGSKIANLTGNGYNNSQEMLKHMLWPSSHKVNEIFCSYGNRHESTCEQVLVKFLAQRVRDPNDPLKSFTITHPGLVKDINCLGYSPDGHVHETYTDGSTATFLSEYKCPFSKRKMDPGPEHRGLDIYSEASGKPNIYNTIAVPRPRTSNFPTQNVSNTPPTVSSKRELFPIPGHYYDQVQWGMGLGVRQKLLYTKSPTYSPSMKCYFVVWTPNYSQLCEVPMDVGYAEHLRALALDFMENHYFPAVKLKLSGDLVYPQIQPSSPPGSPPTTSLTPLVSSSTIITTKDTNHKNTNSGKNGKE